MPQNKTFIISLGGSLIVPDEIDAKYLSQLKKTLSQQKTLGQKFILAPGGGRTARRYAEAVAKLGDQSSVDSDWLGIYAIKLNQLLLTFIFKDQKHISIMEGKYAKPGQSSDGHAVLYAKEHKAHAIVNLSNVDYVYDKNPKKHKDAKPIANISWADFRKIVGSKWEANQSWPFDPVASKMAEQLKLKVVFMNGKNLPNLKDFLSGKKFKGTVIG